MNETDQIGYPDHIFHNEDKARVEILEDTFLIWNHQLLDQELIEILERKYLGGNKDD